MGLQVHTNIREPKTYVPMDNILTLLDPRTRTEITTASRIMTAIEFSLLKLTEIAYIPLSTNMYILIPIKPHIIKTACLRGQWSKLKESGLSIPLLDEAINLPHESPSFKLKDDVIYLTKANLCTRN